MDHLGFIAVVYGAGVAVEPTFCTYAIEKSRVIIAYSMVANAPTKALA